MDTPTNLITHVWDYFNVSSTDRKKKYIEIPNTSRKHFAESLGAYAARTTDRPLRVVEVGSHRGEFAETLCKHISTIELTVVDPYVNYQEYIDFQERDNEQTWREVQERLRPYNVSFLRMMSVDGAARFSDASVDMVYIDANHKFEYVVEDILAWMPKICSGGLLSGHDYFTSTRGHCEVRTAVEFVQRKYPKVQVTTFGQRMSCRSRAVQKAVKQLGLDLPSQRTWCWGIE